MDKSAMERLLLLGDYSSTWTMIFNDAAAPSSFDTHKTIATSDLSRTEKLTISGQNLINEVLLTDMALSRAADGSLIITGPAVLSNGTNPAWS